MSIGCLHSGTDRCEFRELWGGGVEGTVGEEGEGMTDPHEPTREENGEKTNMGLGSENGT